MPKFEAKKFRAFEIELNGISKRAMEEHYKLYQGYVGKSNEILERQPMWDASARFATTFQSSRSKNLSR